VATEHLPGLFFGVLEMQLGPITNEGYLELGSLRFPSDVEEVFETYLILQYSAS
jgi:hypothetical protein